VRGMKERIKIRAEINEMENIRKMEKHQQN
jgi:hypothetical protein